MVALQFKTQIPATRHLKLDLDLPKTINPGDAEIVLIVNSPQLRNNSEIDQQNRLKEKLLKCSTWSEDDLSGFKQFREDFNKWQPKEF